MKRYIFKLTEKYTSFLSKYGHILKLFPPRKSLKNKSLKEPSSKFQKNNDIKTFNNKKKKSSIRTINQNSQSFKKSSQDFILDLTNKNSQIKPLKEKPKEDEAEVDIYI